jgi:hypothetical protein
LKNTRYGRNRDGATRFGKNFDNENLMRDDRHTVKNARKQDGGTPEQAVNRTNKADYGAQVAHKNQRHDPVPRIQGSDDMRAIPDKRRNQRI